ncbi:MAG: C4-dicarboxylate ABC transporter permease, partial [Deltaproteobacteria bacterium]|nr:C4-dicarboxylate ABC transporter permease [Deltaproteobacteria bacterium]
MSTTTVAGWEQFSKQKATKWLLCIAAALGAIAMLGSTGIVFAILLMLMLTGMPISIALGLT